MREIREPTKLFSPLLWVFMQTDDGSEPKPVLVQTANMDLLLWDKTRAAHKWPKMDESPFKWFTFLAWAAMRRLGMIAVDLKYEKFEVVCLSVEPVEDEKQESVDPSQSEAEPA